MKTEFTDSSGWMKYIIAGIHEFSKKNLKPFQKLLCQKSEIQEDNFYNSVRLAQTLTDRNVRVCGTLRAIRGIPLDSASKKRIQRSGGMVT